MTQGWAAPEGPQRSRSRGRGCLIAVGAAVVLGLLVVGCLAVIASDPPTDTATPDSPRATQQAAKHLGQPVRDGQFEFVVQRIRCGVAQVGDEFLNKQAQGQYCLVSVRVQNIGDEQRTFEQSSQLLFDTEGRKYGTDEAGLYLSEGKSFLEEINPGNAVDGVLVYDVPKGFKVARIELHDSAFSGGVTVDF